MKINPDSIKEIHLFSEKKTRIKRIVVYIVVIGTFVGLIIYGVNHMFEP